HGLVGRVVQPPLYRLEGIGPGRGAHGPRGERAVVGREQGVELGPRIPCEYLVIAGDEIGGLPGIPAPLAHPDRGREAGRPRGAANASSGTPEGTRVRNPPRGTGAPNRATRGGPPPGPRPPPPEPGGGGRGDEQPHRAQREQVPARGGGRPRTPGESLPPPP